MTDAEALFERRTVDGRLIETLQRPALAASLELLPHPEGGWYRRTWTSPLVVDVDHTRTRPAATLIVFMLPAGELSAWHRVESDEIWIWSGGGSITLQLGGNGPSPEPAETYLLGEAESGAAPQVHIPAGHWQKTLIATHDALASCVVSPGFDFEDFSLADED